jgi:hypothetical protein
LKKKKILEHCGEETSKSNAMDKLLLILTIESERCFQLEGKNVILVHVQKESILKGINFQSI